MFLYVLFCIIFVIQFKTKLKYKIMENVIEVSREIASGFLVVTAVLLVLASLFYIALKIVSYKF